MSNGPIEPRADLRQAAAELRQWYLALTQEGFNAQEALVIIGQILAAQGGAS